jgi:hypothetical protein
MQTIRVGTKLKCWSHTADRRPRAPLATWKGIIDVAAKICRPDENQSAGPQVRKKMNILVGLCMMQRWHMQIWPTFMSLLFHPRQILQTMTMRYRFDDRYDICIITCLSWLMNNCTGNLFSAHVLEIFFSSTVVCKLIRLALLIKFLIEAVLLLQPSEALIYTWCVQHYSPALGSICPLHEFFSLDFAFKAACHLVGRFSKCTVL